MRKLKIFVLPLAAVVILLVGIGTGFGIPRGASNDVDRDGMPDWWERKYGLDLARSNPWGDPDRDHLRNRPEFRHETFPNDVDADNDALNDYEEVRQYFTFATKKDSDADGLADGEEVRTFLTDPNYDNRLVSGPALNIAHRGASTFAPENTIAAFDLAERLGADFVEFDVRSTQDGALVLLHDHTLDRTTSGPADDCRGTIETKLLAQIAKCDAGGWFNDAYPKLARREYEFEKIPTVPEVFSRFAESIDYYIELKVSGVEDEIVQSIGAFSLEKNVVVQSFNPTMLRKVHDLDPTIRLIQLYNPGTSKEILLSQLDGIKDYAWGLAAYEEDVDGDLVTAAHTAGLQVHAWTVDDRDRMNQLLLLSVDGIHTNRPNALNQIFRAGMQP